MPPAIWLFFAGGAAVPSFEKVRAEHRRSDALLMDRHGEILQEQRISSSGRRLDWISLQQISPPVVSTIIFAEDKRFFVHSGIDWRAILASVVCSILSGSPRGTSTITMQLASILKSNLRPKAGRRSILQKLNQFLLARSIERTWSKEQILEAYLNLISYRGELQGIAAASRGLFQKEPHGIN